MDQQASTSSGPRARGWLDRSSRALAAGMGLSELRAILRGEPPTERPNPRYRAHLLSFLLHFRPRTYTYASTWFTHTFRLGFFAVYFGIVEVITGLALMFYYVPSPDAAYESILRLQVRVPWGEVLRDVHRLAAELMVATVALHLLRTYLTKSYQGQRAFTWITGVALLLLTLLLTFSGYLLPWDQLAYWAVTIGTGMADGVPWIGAGLRDLLRGAAEIGGDGLLRFYQLHVVLLPLLAAILLGVHYYRVARIHSISLPARVEEGDLPEPARRDALRRVDLLPDLLIHEGMLAAIATLVLLAAAIFFYDAPLESHANPLKTPLEAQAPWFFLWVQGLLKLGSKTLMGVVVPSASGVGTVPGALPGSQPQSALAQASRGSGAGRRGVDRAGRFQLHGHAILRHQAAGRREHQPAPGARGGAGRAADGPLRRGAGGGVRGGQDRCQHTATCVRPRFRGLLPTHPGCQPGRAVTRGARAAGGGGLASRPAAGHGAHRLAGSPRRRTQDL